MSGVDTPIADFCRAYAQKGGARLHVPGHKGRGPLGCEALDLTEIAGADELYDAGGIIARSEENAARLFGATRTFYSTEGSSHGIRAMLFLAMRRGGSRQVLAARNAHRAFLSACALLDLEPLWLLPESPCEPCRCPVSPEGLERRLRALPRLPLAVYVTSPDYLGGMQDIAGLSAVCRRFGLPLLVDNAHGAYLHFLPRPLHPLDLGASMCCDSAHKTLPVLTGGAYLHLGAFEAEETEVRRALALFGSTSPSYLTLQSLDLCNRALAEDYPRRLRACVERLGRTRARLREGGFSLLEGEPLKLTINTARAQELAQKLREEDIESEYAGRGQLVLMFSPDNREEEFAAVERFFAAGAADFAKDGGERAPRLPPLELPRACSVREASFAPTVRIPVRQALGRVCASPSAACPPAVPIVASGERITAEAVEALLRFGVDKIDVCEGI